MIFEYSFSGKWLELLKEIAPDVKRVAVLRDTIANVAGLVQFGVIQAMAPALRVDVNPINCATPTRSSAPSQSSRVLRMAA